MNGQTCTLILSEMVNKGGASPTSPPLPYFLKQQGLESQTPRLVNTRCDATLRTVSISSVVISLYQHLEEMHHTAGSMP